MELTQTRYAASRLQAAAPPYLVRSQPPSPITVALTTYSTSHAIDLLPALAASPDLIILPEAHADSADVMLALASSITEEVLDDIEQASARAEKPGRSTVLVSDPLNERHLSRALAAGVVCILPRRSANAATVHRTIIAGYEGRPVLPDTVVRWLLEDFRLLRERMLEPQGPQPGGFTEREIEVLRLLAEGQSTAEMADRMNYSQRTIKKIVQDLLVRLNLKNRSHAVSYAMRMGAI